MHVCCSFLLFFGRLCLAAIFLMAGIGKFLAFDATAGYMASVGLPMVPVLLVIAALVEIFGAIFLILGWNTRLGATLLLLFLIPTTYFFHDFWNLPDGAERSLQMINFLKNLAIFGGLLYVISCGPGKWACDRAHCPHCSKEPLPPVAPPLPPRNEPPAKPPIVQ